MPSIRACLEASTVHDADDPDLMENLALRDDVIWFERNPTRVFRSRRPYPEEMRRAGATAEDFKLAPRIRVLVCRIDELPAKGEPIFIREAALLPEDGIDVDLPEDEMFLAGLLWSAVERKAAT